MRKNTPSYIECLRYIEYLRRRKEDEDEIRRSGMSSWPLPSWLGAHCSLFYIMKK